MTGNFLNLPYNHPEYPTRYALDDEGNALDNLDMFITHYESKVVSNLGMVAIKKKERENTAWKGAPQRLVTLASRGIGHGARNTCILKGGSYLRHRFPDTELEQKQDE